MKKLKTLAWGAAAIALACVFLAYLRPDFIVGLSNVTLLCQ